MKDILSRAAFAGKVLCLVAFIAIAQACGLSALAAMSVAFIGQFSGKSGDSRAAKARVLQTADAGAETSP